MFAGVSRRIVLAGMGALTITRGEAADYPNGPIKVVVPYPAGGTADILFRLLGNEVERRIGVSFIVVNMTGAAGNIGTANVARSPADGYTLVCAATNNFVINQFMMPLQFDPLKDLQPVVRLANIPLTLFSNPKVPAKDLREFIEYAKARPGKLNYASTGLGTTPHLQVERLKQLTGMDILHIPYPGAPQIMQDLMRNEIQFYAGSLSTAAGLIEKGDVTALAIAWGERFPGAPNLPTAAECGVPNFIAPNWFAVAAPHGTPKNVIELLNREFVRAMNNPGMRERYIELGFMPDPSSPQQLAEAYQVEAAQWASTIARLGIKPR